MATLNWGYCQGEIWCPFRLLTLDDDLNSSYGVYIIWREESGQISETYVGEGIIGERISEHRREYRFNFFTKNNSYVTWAKIPSGNKTFGRKIEQYFIRTLPNTINVKEARAEEPANSPWDYPPPWLQ